MTVRTVAQALPVSMTWPTSAPDSFMTQSPTSMPQSLPLLSVSVLDQFDAP